MMRWRPGLCRTGQAMLALSLMPQQRSSRGEKRQGIEMRWPSRVPKYIIPVNVHGNGLRGAGSTPKRKIWHLFKPIA